MKKHFLIAASLSLTSGLLFAETQPGVQVYQTPPVQTSTGAYVVVPSTPGGVVVPVVPAQPQPTTVVVTPPPPPPPPPKDKDEEHHHWGEFNISGGKAMFKGSSGDFLDDSPSVDIGFFGPLDGFGQMGMEFGYVTGASLKGPLPGRLNPTIAGVPASGAFTTDVKAHIARATPEVRFGPLIKAGDMRIMPYVVGGGGFYWTRYNSDSITFGSGSASLPSNNDYNGGWNAGGGLTLGLTPSFGIGGDIRYHRIMYSNGPDTEYLLPEGKLVFMF